MTMSKSVWKPARTLAECDALMCGPGMPHEMETCLIDGRMQRVYKNLWPSLRAFWLWSAAEHKDNTYIVFESQRPTYHEVLQDSLHAAALFSHAYGIQKGDRVAICSRNMPEYLVAFWACHLIGAVSVLINAWLPSEALTHCLVHTGSKLILMDIERADRLLPAMSKLREAGVRGFVVFDDHVHPSRFPGAELWSDTLKQCQELPAKILSENTDIGPEDHATIIFTSGTTGVPKGVLSTQRQFLTNIRNASVASTRAYLRRGEKAPNAPVGPQRALLVPVPFFHVTGSTSLSMVATTAGLKIVLMRRWDPREAVRLISEENVRVAGGVPAMVLDLVESSLDKAALDVLLFGGSSSPSKLPANAKSAFPTTMLSQAYGMTETNSIAVGIAGEDYLERPTSSGRPCPVNDVSVVDKDGRVVPAGQMGEVWMRGPNVMKGYWRDPEATAKAITRDGWIRSGDLGMLDAEGFLYIRDRIKDLIIRGGENIASVTVENAIYADPRVAQVAAVGVPDERLGELVAAVISVKASFVGEVKESEIIEVARRSLPKFAVPVMVVVQDTAFDLTPSEKILKAPLRDLARAEWERRKKHIPAPARL